MATQLPHHLHIFNLPHTSDREFPQFARLPKELRLYIWQLSLPLERFVRVELSDRNEERGGKDELDYSVKVLGTQLIPKLLHTCSEARQIASSRYRIRMPCRYTRNEQAAGVLYINPEFDIIKVDTDHCPQAFANFVIDLRARDHKGLGLQQLAITSNALNRLDGLPVASLDSARRDAFKVAISSLKRVIFLCIESAGREYLGYFGGIPGNRGFELHRSRPIFPLVSNFNRLAQDPRPIDRDLSRVFVGTGDPRCMPQHWKHLISSWQCQQQATLQFLVAHSDGSSSAPGTENIVDRQTALNWVQNAETSWLKKQERFRSQIERNENLTIPLESEEELHAAPQAAMGFWLFPIEAIGQMPGGNGYNKRERYWRPKRVLDLGKYRPQLYVASLS